MHKFVAAAVRAYAGEGRLHKADAYARIACVPVLAASASCLLVALLAVLMPEAGVPVAECEAMLDLLVVLHSVPCLVTMGVAAVQVSDLMASGR